MKQFYHSKKTKSNLLESFNSKNNFFKIIFFSKMINNYNFNILRILKFLKIINHFFIKQFVKIINTNSNISKMILKKI